jgi:glycine dehydrogenase subunit 2
MFDRQIAEIARRVHHAGALVYLDGANMNAILGISRPGDFGAGGGPGAGPIAVSAALAPYLPVPIVVRSERGYALQSDRPQSIGRVRSFFGNVGVLVRAYCYLRTHGPEGLRRASENAVLNANYLLTKVKDVFPVPQGDRCMHEFVASASGLKASRGVAAMDIAKRLLDYGFHAPTVYFPPIVREAMMIEPTETETKETLDAFAETLVRISQEPPELVAEAPHTTPISRPDEVRAARQPVLSWRAASGPAD